jgi:hypothetical protein
MDVGFGNIAPHSKDLSETRSAQVLRTWADYAVIYATD